MHIVYQKIIYKRFITQIMPLVMEFSVRCYHRMTYGIDKIKIELVMIGAYKMKRQSHDPFLSFN